MQADRAHAAAHAGAEWGAYQAVVKGNIWCQPSAFDLNQAPLSGFRVTVTCTAIRGADVRVEINRRAGEQFRRGGYASRRVVPHVW